MAAASLVVRWSQQAGKQAGAQPRVRLRSGIETAEVFVESAYSVPSLWLLSTCVLLAVTVDASVRMRRNLWRSRLHPPPDECKDLGVH